MVNYRLLCNGSKIQPDDYVLSRPVFIGRSTTDSLRMVTGYCSDYPIHQGTTQQSQSDIDFRTWESIRLHKILVIIRTIIFASSWSLGVIPKRRALSQNSRPLSHKSIKIRKYTIRAAQNIQNFQNRPNSRKVTMIWKNCHFFTENRGKSAIFEMT